MSERVIGCALTVSGTLGSGLLERVYKNALAHDAILIELTIVRALDEAHRAQCLN